MSRHPWPVPVLVSLLMATAVAAAAGTEAPLELRFSASPVGSALPAGWQPYLMSRKKPVAVAALVADDGTSVLRITTDKTAGAVAHAAQLPATAQLQWRWKVDHSLPGSSLSHRNGDDFAARVYVFFDLPRSELSWAQRTKLDLASHALGETLPTAALCYVWAGHEPVGSTAPSPFSSQIHTIVLQSGDALAGQWQTERRDVAADYRQAFGKAPPAITGVAVAADSDNSSGQATAWFGDLTLTPTPTPPQ